jgi:hypothetical protein
MKKSLAGYVAFITVIAFIILLPSFSCGRNNDPNLPSKPTEDSNSLSAQTSDANQIIDQLKTLAEQGDPNAQFDLGFRYEFGLGVLNNNQKAVEWYTKAAEQGYAEAQALLAVMYAKGEGVDQDYKQAIEWCTKAAEQGYAEAQYGLGLGYYEGESEGFIEDYIEAYKWFLLAEMNGKDVSEVKEELKNKMTPKQIALAKQKAREFVKAQEKGNGQGKSERKYTLVSDFQPCMSLEGQGNWLRLPQQTQQNVLFRPREKQLRMATTVKKENIFDFAGEALGGAGQLAGGIVGGAGRLRQAYYDPYGAEMMDLKIQEAKDALASKQAAQLDRISFNQRFNQMMQQRPYGRFGKLQINAYGLGVHMNQYGQPVKLWPDFGGVYGEQLQIKQDAYGPGIHMDQYGRPVREYPWP